MVVVVVAVETMSTAVLLLPMGPAVLGVPLRWKVLSLVKKVGKTSAAEAVDADSAHLHRGYQRHMCFLGREPYKGRTTNARDALSAL